MKAKALSLKIQIIDTKIGMGSYGAVLYSGICSVGGGAHIVSASFR